MITRRGFLGLTGAIFATALGMGCTGREGVQTSVHTPTPSVAEKEYVHLPELPWKYEKLDPEHVADLGYEGYMEAHCMYGVFNAVVTALEEKVGFPYSEFPTHLSVYGKGGVVGWATLCGALNGAAMAAYLVLPEKDADEIINELYSWYQVTELPEYVPEEPKKADLSPFPKSVANSPLCHASVTNWCEASGYRAFSAERSERCGRLTADVAKKLVELLNAKADGTFVAAYPLDERTASCRGCHTKGSPLENTRGKMHCESCHDVSLIEEHPRV